MEGAYVSCTLDGIPSFYLVSTESRPGELYIHLLALVRVRRPRGLHALHFPPCTYHVCSLLVVTVQAQDAYK